MSEIRTKREFYRLWEAGVLGNKLRTWRDPSFAYASGAPTLGLREVGASGGGKLSIVERADLLAEASKWNDEGRRYVICEAAPDRLATIQGEVMRAETGWAGTLGFVKDGKRMRESMRDGDLAPMAGLAVLDLLRRHLDPNSLDDLYSLLDAYPDAVVELTSYSVAVGELPRRNTIFWEVRNY